MLHAFFHAIWRTVRRKLRIFWWDGSSIIVLSLTLTKIFSHVGKIQGEIPYRIISTTNLELCEWWFLFHYHLHKGARPFFRGNWEWQNAGFTCRGDCTRLVVWNKKSRKECWIGRIYGDAKSRAWDNNFGQWWWWRRDNACGRDNACVVSIIQQKKYRPKPISKPG